MLVLLACRVVPPMDTAPVSETPADTDDTAPLTNTTLIIDTATDTAEDSSKTPEVRGLSALHQVNAGPMSAVEIGTIDATAAYADLGVTGVRTHGMSGPLDMATMFPDRRADPADPGSYDFTESDVAWAAITDAGLVPTLRLGDSFGRWCSGQVADRQCCEDRPEVCGVGSAPADIDAWAAAAATVAARYCGDGACAAIEIWNEPDNSDFWDGTDEAFVALYAATAAAVSAAVPGVPLGGPGFSPQVALTGSGLLELAAFLDGVQQADARLDYLSWHVYAHDPDVVRGAVEGVRAVLADAGLAELPMQVTEYNLDASVAAARWSPDGAAWLLASWLVLAEEGVEAAHLYRGVDRSPDWAADYGLLALGEDGGLSWKAIAEAAWMVGQFVAENEAPGALPGLTLSGGMSMTGSSGLALLVSLEDDPLRFALADGCTGRLWVSEGKGRPEPTTLPREGTLEAPRAALVRVDCG
jgi:hypothetical protein